jgi:predicted dehydrogenase
LDSRRDFLQKLAGSIIAFPALADAPPLRLTDEPQEGRILRVAIMGLGGYGSMVAHALQSCKRAKLVGLISGTPTKQKEWQKKYNVPDQNCYNYENFDTIRDNPDIDIVYVITPNALHHDQVIRVARAGKHVISEKPMGLNAKEGQEMVDACKKANVRLLVGYRMHFEPHTLEVVRMRKAGEFGKLTFFQGLSGFKIGDPSQWRLNKQLAGGGSLMDIGIYSINGSRYMIGEDPVWVTAQETKTDPVLFKEGVDETIQFQLGFPSGVVASCLSSYNMNFLDRFFLSGHEGFAELMPATGYGPIKGRTHKGEINQPAVVHQTVQLDEMAAMIFDGHQAVIPADGQEAVKDLKIIDAIYQAVKSGEKVSLDL